MQPKKLKIAEDAVEDMTTEEEQDVIPKSKSASSPKSTTYVASSVKPDKANESTAGMVCWL